MTLNCISLNFQRISRDFTDSDVTTAKRKKIDQYSDSVNVRTSNRAILACFRVAWVCQRQLGFLVITWFLVFYDTARHQVREFVLLIDRSIDWRRPIIQFVGGKLVAANVSASGSTLLFIHRVLAYGVKRLEDVQCLDNWQAMFPVVICGECVIDDEQTAAFERNRRNYRTVCTKANWFHQHVTWSLPAVILLIVSPSGLEGGIVGGLRGPPPVHVYRHPFLIENRL